MGKLIQIEVENFKSYRGHQVIGPFDNFTSVIGPNGSGKSNLMDAISFVLGIQSSHLRSSKLKDLIYRNDATAAPVPVAAQQSKKRKKTSKGKGKGKGKLMDQDGEDEDGDENDDDDDGDDDENEERVGAVGGMAGGAEGSEDHPTRASVTAVYVNSAKKEVRFSRIITSAGSSEYRINDRQVPLAKYSSALEDENILIKARNFLVFQGDVEAIAAQSPKDLTKLIEQISGSLELKPEYERLKSIQDKATEQSAMNFNKKKGINAEMKQFKEQKEEAERFEKMMKQKAKQTMTYLLWKLFHQEEKVKDLQESINGEKSASAEKFEAHAQAEAAVKETKKAMAKATKDSLKFEKRSKQRKAEIDERKPNQLKLQEKIKHGSKKLGQSKDNMAKAEKDLFKQQEALGALDRSLKEVTKALEKFEASAKKKGSKSKAQFTPAMVAEYNTRKEELANQTFQLRQELSAIQRDVKTETENKLRLDEDLQSAKMKEGRLVDDETSTKDRIEKITEDVNRLKKELIQAKGNLEEIETERRKLRQLDAEKNEKLTEVQQRLSDARADMHESEKSVKKRETLEALKRVFPGVFGRLTDLCKPTQRKYDLAVSTILGRNIDAIVVDCEKTGIECIQYMRDQRSGTATFLPLDTLSVKPINEKYRNFARGARLAVDVIQVDPRFERAVHFACGNALVCETLEVAKDVCWGRNQEVKAVTLEGTVLHKTGLMTGGTSVSSNRDAKRWEDQDIEALRTARDTLLAEISEISKNRRKIASEEQIRSEIASIQSKLDVASDSLNNTKRKATSLAKELDQIRKEIDKIEPKLEKLVSSVQSKTVAQQEVESKLHKIEDTVFDSFCRKMGVANIRDFEEGQGAEQREIEQRRLEFDTNIAKYTNEITFETNQIKEIENRIAKLQQAIEDDSQVLEANTAELEAFNTETDKLQSELDEYNTSLDNANAVLSDRAKEVEAAKKELVKASKELETGSKKMLALEAEVETLFAERVAILRKCKLEEIHLPLMGQNTIDDVSLEELDRAQVNQVAEDDQMNVDEPQNISVHQITVNYSSLKGDLKQDGSDEVEIELQENLRNLSAEIERMAPNMKAGEKFDDVEAKLKITAEEFENARKEAKSAKDAFVAIKQERFDMFSAAFNHISDTIDKIYKDLTRSKTFPLGGTAYLSLEDSEEPYLDGVKFHAMPPMKRFRDMEQLSGGEKTVAALALLFAVHSFRPAPFFVLDEVDAALDNANVARVANYVRTRASEDFQFVVISLKSTFYEKAEALVGIYKDQESASSKVLTLSLEGMED